MDFGFTDEQELIRTEVRNLARKFDWEYWRIKDKTGEYPHEFFDEFAKAGWLGIAMPREYGGRRFGHH
jgi:acyl-CoA dehydrogenase